MADTYVKVDGVWKKVNRTYQKISGVWTSVSEIAVKNGGVWKEAFLYDITPPDPPILSADLVDGAAFGGTGRLILVHARSDTDTHDSGLKRIRVLTTYNGAMPTTQYGGTYTSSPDQFYPHEPWSDFSYNGFNDSSLSKDSSALVTKYWPLNATYNSVLAAGNYHFAAWAEDLAGNWSEGTFVTLNVPKVPSDTDVVHKEKRFDAASGGTMKQSTFNFGDLEMTSNQNGLFFYGTSIKNAFGKDGTPTIKSAQIYVNRRDDSGKASANVYLFWHTHQNRDAISGTGINNIDKHNIKKLGTVAKGEAKWFDLPDDYIDDLAAGHIVGFGFNHKPASASTANADDYLVLKKVGDAPRSGELHVVWTEKP